MSEQGLTLGGSLGLALAAAVSVAAPAAAMAADSDPQAELRRLQQEAQQARRDAEAALERAIKAEAAISAALGLEKAADPTPPVLAASPTKPDCSPSAQTLQRMDCFEKGTGSNPTEIIASARGLMAYALNDEVEDDALTYLNGLSDQGEKKTKREVSFMQIAQPVTSRLLITNKSEAFEGTYTYPVGRKRELTADGLSVKPITSTFSVGFSAAIDPDDKASGLLFRDGSFNNDTVAVTFGYGEQYYPAMPIYGKKDSVEARAKSFGQALWEQCEKAAKATANIYGDDPEKPRSCQGDELIAWSFDPSRDAAFKANVAAYNAAFWDPVTSSVPLQGWGLVGGLGTRNFKFIDPLTFAPGIVSNPQFPRLLATLSTEPPAGGGLFLDEQGARRWSTEAGVYGFHHIDGKWGPINGLLARIDLNVARRWDFAPAAKDQEFCAFKVATPGIGACKTFNIAEPESNVSFEPSLNLRTQLKFGKSFPRLARFIPALAISPRITLNTDTEAYRLEVPLYLSGNDKLTELTGGIRYVTTWNHEIDANNGTVWSVFVSTPFSMDGSKK